MRTEDSFGVEKYMREEIMVGKLKYGLVSLAVLASSGVSNAQVKVALIEGMSGPFARIGETLFAQLKADAELINHAGGVNGQKIEVIALDNKTSPQESLIQFKAATDQGVRYITQGASSSVAHALVDAVNKWNARNPDKAVVFLNHSSADPTLTNEKCSFWHFRFEANSDMKVEGWTGLMEKDKSIHKVYMMNQDYAAGHQVQKAVKVMLAKRRPDVKIVGDDLTPIGRVKDFSPYISKIQASGADTIITANWGSDLTLLVKAAKDAGVKAKFYTMFAHAVGTPAALTFAGDGQVVNMSEWHRNVTLNKASFNNWVDEFDKKNKPNEFVFFRLKTMMGMLAKAMNTAKSVDPKAVALALEDMRYQSETGEVWMRKADHQIHMPMYISTFAKVDGKSVKYDTEETGMGWKTIAPVSVKDTQLATTCVMERPQ